MFDWTRSVTVYGDFLRNLRTSVCDIYWRVMYTSPSGCWRLLPQNTCIGRTTRFARCNEKHKNSQIPGCHLRTASWKNGVAHEGVRDTLCRTHRYRSRFGNSLPRLRISPRCSNRRTERRMRDANCFSGVQRRRTAVWKNASRWELLQTGVQCGTQRIGYLIASRILVFFPCDQLLLQTQIRESTRSRTWTWTRLSIRRGRHRGRGDYMKAGRIVVWRGTRWIGPFRWRYHRGEHDQGWRRTAVKTRNREDMEKKDT